VSRQLTYRLTDEDVHHAVVDTEFDDHGHHHEPMPADIYASDIRMVNGGYIFNVHIADHIVTDVHLHVGGLHNVENMLAAVAVAHSLRISDELIHNSVSTYRGVKRRFEYVVNATVNGQHRVLIDDYAHHPEELRALITSAKKLFPLLACSIVFQPHLYSRTRDLAADFAAVLSLADEVVLLPIYPARELPMEGVSSQLIAAGITHGRVQVLEKEALAGWVRDRQPAMLITAGAGDIDTLLPTLKNTMEATS
jgi:UDP-N-acetylmuramate--alanine ligase